MKNFIQAGDKFTYTAGGTVTSGDFVIVGALSGVAENSGGSGDVITVLREGVFLLGKTTGTAWSKGDALFWNSATSKFGKDPTKTSVRAVAFEDAASGDATGYVQLNESAGGMKYVSGQHTTVDADDTVVTGLSLVVGAVATLDSDPVIGATDVVATIGDQAGAPAAGSIQIKTFKPTAVDNATPTAGTTFSKKVNWIAFGY